MRIAAKKIPPISPQVEARLWASIEKRPNGIWAWLRSRAKPHAARIFICGGLYAINRVMWVLIKRRTDPDYQIPDGMDVCHRNDVTEELYDCNPDNLWLGTHQENMDDRERKGRGNQPSGDRNGSRLHPEKLKRGDQHPFHVTPYLASAGIRNCKAKLNWEKVADIRTAYSAGGTSQRKLALKYGVYKSTIARILNGKGWDKKHPENTARQNSVTD